MRRACTAVALVAIAACGGDDSEIHDALRLEVTPDSVIDVGLATPESVLHDEQTDTYLVSNINGEPLGRDDNGFIARLRPDGGVEELKWIDGAAEGITLHAPKGMGFRGDTLFVADIDSVRAFDRATGAPLGARGVANASFLNDIAVGEDGVYVTDTGVDASFAPTGTAAIHRFGPGGAELIASGDALSGPNGIIIDDGSIIVVPFGSNTVLRVRPGGGAPETVATLPTGQLDGVVRLDDGSLLVSSWEGSAVYRVYPTGAITKIVDNVASPADIGWDAGRRSVLIPLFTDNRVAIREVR